MIQRLTLTLSITLAIALVLATSSAAQTPAPLPDGREDVDTLGVTFGVIKFGGFHSNGGIDATYATATRTEPLSPLGFRFGFAGTVGFHHFGDGGGTLKLFQGGAHIKADKIGSASLPLYGNVLIGAGNYFGATDMFLTLAIGGDFPIEGQPFKIRAEVAQVWDFFDGGSSAGWRFAGGIALPLR